MSVCPVPKKAKRTAYSPGKITSTPKQPKYEICGGGTTSVIAGPGTNITTTVCCPNPGPPGPKGCALKWESAWGEGKTYYYEGGDPCVTSLVTNKNVTYICKQSNEAVQYNDEPGEGENWMEYWDVFMSMSGTGSLNWAGSFLSGTTYKKNDVILSMKDGNAYVCMQEHTSTGGGAMDFTGDPGYKQSSMYWEAMTAITVTEEEKTFLSSLMDGVMDWWSGAEPWEKALGIAAGLGLAYAGSKIYDNMTKTGDEPSSGGGSADSRYNGTAGYNGTYTAPTLPVVVASILDFAGYESAEYDVSLLEAKPVNFSITGGLNGRSLLNQLALTYQFDIVPSGGIIKFVPKYQGVARNLTLEDMGHAKMGGSTTGPAPYTARRLQGIDLPRSITFSYYSSALDHNVFTQVSEIPTYEDGQDVSIAVPFTLTDEEAARIAQTTLVNAHIEQQEYTFMTDYHNIDLEPGDVITIPLGTGETTQVRIKEINESEDGLLEFRVSRSDYNMESYTDSGVPVVSPPAQPTNVPVSIGNSDTMFIEVPPIDSSDSKPRIVGIVTGYGKAGWPGANIYRSVDGGATYTLAASTSVASTWGMVSSPIASASYYVWDDTTQISVTLKEGTLSNRSDIAVLNGQNWCMIGEEVIGFVNATLTGPKTYTLSRLLRGRAGSEVKISSHLANELFVLLDGNPVEIEIPVSELRNIVKYKTVTVGSSIDKVDAQDVQPFGLNMLPWAPGNGKVTNVGNDIVLTWVERPRLNNGLQDDRELVHDADWAGYGVTIFSDSTLTTVKRSAIPVTPTYTYTEAMQIADFGSVQTQLYTTVCQMSTVLGGGYPTRINL